MDGAPEVVIFLNHFKELSVHHHGRRRWGGIWVKVVHNLRFAYIDEKSPFSIDLSDGIDPLPEVEGVERDKGGVVSVEQVRRDGTGLAIWCAHRDGGRGLEAGQRPVGDVVEEKDEQQGGEDAPLFDSRGDVEGVRVVIIEEDRGSSILV